MEPNHPTNYVCSGAQAAASEITLGIDYHNALHWKVYDRFPGCLFPRPFLDLLGSRQARNPRFVSCQGA